VQTITFYSYKGGTGRTLTLANVARYLARFGRKVFAIDLDLEAPGLHFKLLGAAHGLPSVESGIVDYLHEFVTTGTPPRSLRPYAITVPQVRSDDATINVLPAGDVSVSSYWRKLSQISWHDLFYTDVAQGIPLFLDLQQKIQEEFAPDFLLIDARTGITEIGGVATTVLADTVVCTLLTNLENLYGARAVLRSIRSTPRISGQEPVAIVTVLSRIPPIGHEEERHLVERTLTFLNEVADDLAATLSISDLLVLHSEPRLQVNESLLVGAEHAGSESPLLRDYLRLITRLVPPSELVPQVQRLVTQIIGSALDDPDRAQSELEALAETSGHPDAYRALLKFYRLRSIPDAKMLGTAEQLWDISGDTSDEVLWDIMERAFSRPVEKRSDDRTWRWIEGLWREGSQRRATVGWALAKTLRNFDEPEKAAPIIMELIENDEVPPIHFQFTLEVLRANGSWAVGDALIMNRIESRDLDPPTSEAIAEFLLRNPDKQLLREYADLLLGFVDLEFRVRILQAMDRSEEVTRVLSKMIDEALEYGRPGQVHDIGERFFARRGNLTEFEQILRSKDLPGSYPIDDILERLRRWDR
jgi:MinD-like ATPase involved in chromosome partitioning or flagellar assembly